MNLAYAEQLANIIRGFRNGELQISLDKNHVLKWVSQFSAEAQNIILSETLHIFKEWFFDIEKIRLFLSEVYEYVCSYYGDYSKVLFLNCQKEGTSQSRLIDELQKMKKVINRSCSTQANHLIYIDDGLYSGQHIIKDLNRILRDDTISIYSIDIFVMVGYSDGVQYVQSEVGSLCQTRNIGFHLYTWKALSNIKKFRYRNNGEEYYLKQDTLWPLSPSSLEEDDPKCIIERITGKRLHYCYRDYCLHHTSSVFSCEKSREVVEREFLKYGFKIISTESIKKGLYPLGFSSSPSLGFGSFCATALNISNTCPIVLWWGNLQKDGSELDKWYPLLPRRINTPTQL